MSHNNNKVGSAEPNRQGEITVNVNDLSDVNASSPSSGEILKYDSSTSKYINAPLVNAQYMLIGQGESDAYSNSGLTSIAATDEFRLYDTSPINEITGASISKVGSTHWVDEITLPAGRYTVLNNIRVVFTASGEFTWRLYSNTATANRSGRASIGENLTSQSFSSTVVSSFVLTQTEAIVIKVVAVSSVDSVANQGNTPSEFSSIYIEKVE